MAGLIQSLAGRGGIRAGSQVDFDVLTYMHTGNPSVTHVLEGALHGLTLGVYYGLFGRDYYLRFHFGHDEASAGARMLGEGSRRR